MNKKIVHQVIDKVCTDQPDQIAIRESGYSIRYGQLKELSDNLAAALIGQGLQRGDFVTAYGKAGIRYVISILGINKASGVFMPLDTSYPMLRSVSLLNRIAPAFYICSSEDLASLKDLLSGTSLSAARILVLSDVQDDPGDGGERDEDPGSLEIFLEEWLSSGVPAARRLLAKPVSGFKAEDIVIQENDTNYLIYTSGSTGDPKIIRGCHKSLSHFIHWEVSKFGVGAQSRIPLLAPITFDVSFRDIFTPLLGGGTLYIPSPEERSLPNHLLSWLRTNGITLMHMVPGLFRSLIRELEKGTAGTEPLPALTHILLAGEPLYGNDVAAWLRVAGNRIRLVNLYGPSETVLAKLFHEIDPANFDERSVIPLGLPLPNTSVLIVNNNELCNQGAIGEIIIKTPFRSNQYLQDEVLNGEKFVQNPLHTDFEDIVYLTGDLGKYLEDGTVAFAGRMDSQVKIRGNRVELLEVETVLNNFPGMGKCVVLAIENAEREKTLACYYTAGEELTTEQVYSWLHERLPAYMHPSYFLQLEEFPLNINGKINRKQLPLPEEILYGKREYKPPVTALEKKLAVIWQEVLALQKVGVTNTFYELGGHSLSATRIISLIYKELEKELNLKEFFDHPTIRELATLIGKRADKQYQVIPRAPHRSAYPLSPAQKRIWIAHEKGLKHLYNMPASCVIGADTDPVALEKAFKTLIADHESLRTGLRMEDGVPMQIVYEQVDFTLSVETGSHQVIRPEQIAEQLRQELAKPFDLEHPPLLRVRLLRITNGKYLLLITIHHIVCDGWSLGVIMHEALAHYGKFRSGQEVTSRPAAIQYKDYAVWHNDATEELVNLHRDYWEQQLSRILTPVLLPTDRPFSDRQLFSGKVTGTVLSEKTSDELRKLALQFDASLFVVLLSAIKILLFKFSGQNDIAVGAPVAGRSHPELENQVGLFLNYLVLRSNLQEDETYGSYLTALRQSVFEAYTHQMYPYDRLVEQYYLSSSDEGRNPFYDVLVVMNNDELNGSRENWRTMELLLGAEKISLDGITSKVALTFFITDDPQIGINLEYSDELFNYGTAQDMLQRLCLLLELLPLDRSASIRTITRLLADQSEGASHQELAEENSRVIKEDF